MANVAPPPVSDPFGSQRWIDWFVRMNREINEVSNVKWVNIDFTSSNITDIVSRDHADLQGLQGGVTGERYHLSSSEHTNVTTTVGANSLKLKSYLKANVPSAATEGEGALIYVSDLTSPAPCYSDGTDWRTVIDGTVI